MHADNFHPQIQESSFILPIDSADANVWSMNTVRSKKIFLISAPLFRGNGPHTASCIRHRLVFAGEWQKAYGLDFPTP